MIEWNSLNKKQEIKFMTLFTLNEFGHFSFDSFFNQHMALKVQVDMHEEKVSKLKWD